MNFNYLSNFITVLQQYDFKFDMQYLEGQNRFMFRITTFKSYYEIVYYDDFQTTKLCYHSKYVTLKQLLKQLIQVRKNLMEVYIKHA